ncbi:hypothetical protein T484DRAFT_1802473 [Baffinella frigidus]|nr:hypothetical protein T484DRAFT_1802473 [Cryptophyta sp. CCMP2293]
MRARAPDKVARLRGAKYVASGAGTGEAAAILPARLCTMVAERLVAAHQRATIGTDAEATNLPLKKISVQAVDLLHVVATLCSSPHGVMALHRSKTLAPVAGTLPQYIQSLNSASRLSGFAALEKGIGAEDTEVLALAKMPAVAEAAGAVAQKGIGAEDAEVLGVGADLEGLAQVAAFLFKLSKSSIQEDKVGALCCMRALSQHAWGLKSLFAIADFLPHLTDRKAESSKRALDEKAESSKRALDEKLRVVEAAIAHPDAEVRSALTTDHGDHR